MPPEARLPATSGGRMEPVPSPPRPARPSPGEGAADAAPADVPAPLWRDVRLLAGLLATVLEESEAADIVDAVERLRAATTALREDPSEERLRAVLDLIDGLDLDRAHAVARAFTVYFHLVNLAEERHRSRTLRERGRDAGPVRESVEAAVAHIRESEGEPVLRDVLDRLAITPVLTAHPTEARRRSVMETLQRIAALVERLDAPLARADEADVRRRLLEEITNLWRTQQVRPARPTPLDEVRAALAVFDATLFQLPPLLYRRLDGALSPADAGARPPRLRPFLAWGSWVGGDRDGNPRVTAEVTRATLAIHAEHVLLGLEQVARRLSRSVTVSDADAAANAALLASLERDEADFPEEAAGMAQRVPDQTHRRKLAFVVERLVATRERRPGAYPDAAAFVRDLRIVQSSLAEAGAARVAYGGLQDLVWQAETFGFHLASLEVRQHSSVHERVLRALAPEVAADVAALDALPARGWPHHLVAAAASAVGARDEAGVDVAEALDTFRAVADLQAAYGPEACHRYVVSFTRSALDVVAVRALAALAVPDRPLRLDVVPLFETADDLSRAPRILDDLVALPGVAAWLDGNDRRLEVMVGYSDSAKEMGFLAANVALYRAQCAMAAWASERDVELTLFHGRGGALGRGGGPAGRAILGQAPGSVAGRFKVTEQGEVIFARYGNLDIARRHLEQVTYAVMLASTPGHEAEVSVRHERYEALAEEMAEVSGAAYRELVESPGFPDFYARVTPIDEIEELQIGSRPARRGGRRDLASLRAIPWVFAWGQSRINLPGWYGLGTGLQAVARRPGGLERLREMHREWPFFRSLLDNAEMSLVKADLDIARVYLGLGDRPDLSAAIEAEHRRTEDLVLAVTGHDRLLAARPVLRRAVELRNPYVDALSFLQVRFLRELRSGTPDADRARGVRELVSLTLNGIAAGLQNTG